MKIRSAQRSGADDEPGRWWMLPLAIVVSAVIGFAAVRDFQHRDLISEQQERLTRLRANLDRTEERFRVAASTLGRREAEGVRLRQAIADAERALRVVREPGLRIVRLAETPDAPPASGHVLMSERDGWAVVYTFDLPPLDVAKTYELWWITEREGPVRAGLFRTKTGAPSRIDTILPRDFGAIQAAAVSVEPAGGVSKPTGRMVLIGNVVSAAG